MARFGSAETEKSTERQKSQPRRIQRHHQKGDLGGDGKAARTRHAAGRRLFGPSRIGLFGGLYIVARAVAQTAGLALSGRVQSVALRLVCEREEEIEKFKPQEYWSVTSTLNQGGKDFDTRLYALNGKKTDKLEISTEEQAASLKSAIQAGNLQIKSVEKKPTKRNPYAPFTTSTMQQDASSRLGGLFPLAHHASGAAAL